MSLEKEKNFPIKPVYTHGPMIKLTCGNKPMYINKHLISSLNEIIDDREECIVTEVRMFNNDVYRVKELVDKILQQL